MKSFSIYKKTILILSLFVFENTLFAQTGRVAGKITDKSNQKEIPFATVTAYQNNIQVDFVYSDFEGFYSLSPIDVGKYDIVISSGLGHQNKVYKDVIIRTSSTTRLNIELSTKKEDTIIYKNSIYCIEPYTKNELEVKTGQIPGDIYSNKFKLPPIPISGCNIKPELYLIIPSGGIPASQGGGILGQNCSSPKSFNFKNNYDYSY